MPGNAADIVVAPVLLDTIAPPHRLLGDKAYDTDAFRALLHELDVALVVARCRGEGRSGEANQWRARSRLVGSAREEGMANEVISDCLKEAVQALGEGLS
jgi:hypothetical protein